MGHPLTGGGLPPLSASERTTHRRLREQGQTDRAALTAVLDAAFVAHLGFVDDGVPVMLPTVFGYDAEHLYLHGSVASKSLIRSPEQTVCVTITIVDGLVLARSVFEHAVNYRSAIIFGTPEVLTEPAEKLDGLRILSNHLAPGQWEYARRPNRKELAATTVLRLSLAEVSVKIRSGPPDDGDGPDAGSGVWAGELPLLTSWGPPVSDPALPAGIAVPPHIANRSGRTPE